MRRRAATRRARRLRRLRPGVTDDRVRYAPSAATASPAFGQEAGLFDEIAVKPLGKRGSEPFQMQVRKRAPRAMGPMRNLIDVGYGVSQVLPVITELFRDSYTPMFLLQPEVHLHPARRRPSGACSAGPPASGGNW